VISSDDVHNKFHKVSSCGSKFIKRDMIQTLMKRHVNVMLISACFFLYKIRITDSVEESFWRNLKFH